MLALFFFSLPLKLSAAYDVKSVEAIPLLMSGEKATSGDERDVEPRLYCFQALCLDEGEEVKGDPKIDRRDAPRPLPSTLSPLSTLDRGS